MAWLRVDDGFDSHPKILALGSDQRRWTWTRILVYTCRYRSDLIPANITDSVPRATRSFLRECVELGLVDVTDSGAYVVHDWDDYQAGDPKKAARQRRWRNGHVDADVDAPVDAPVDASRVGARARPVPNPSPTTSPAAQRQPEDPVPDAAELKAAGWNERQLHAAATDTPRAIALLRAAQADTTCSSPGALAWSKFQAGETPTPQPQPQQTQCPECGVALRPPTTLADHLWQTHDIELAGATK